MKDVKGIGYSFKIIDTPGINSKKDAFQHVYLAREALHCRNHNAIFVMLKFENRYDDMVEKFIQIQSAIVDYNAITAILVSHWELAQDPEKSFIEIKDEF